MSDSPRAPLVPLPVPLPLITEVKTTLAGRQKRFDCTVLARQADHVVVLFIAPGAMHVHGVDLPAGTITFGHFWTGRPYNVYHWLQPQSGATIGHYLNLADQTRLGADRLEWRDLTIDILQLPGQPPLVLDEHELPADLPPAQRERIAAARATALRDLPALLGELERARVALWPTAEEQRRAGQAPGCS